MTQLLADAFQKVSALPEDMQNQIAQELLDGLEGGARWDRTFAEPQDKLDRLAEKAEREYRAGRTQEMGFDELPVLIPQSHIEELDRRMKEHEADPGSALSSEDFWERLERRFGKST